MQLNLPNISLRRSGECWPCCCGDPNWWWWSTRIGISILPPSEKLICRLRNDLDWLFKSTVAPIVAWGDAEWLNMGESRGVEVGPGRDVDWTWCGWSPVMTIDGGWTWTARIGDGRCCCWWCITGEDRMAWWCAIGGLLVCHPRRWGCMCLGKMLTGLVQLLLQLPVAVGSAFGVVAGSGSNLPAKRLCPRRVVSGLVGKVADLRLYGSCLPVPEDTASREV